MTLASWLLPPAVAATLYADDYTTVQDAVNAASAGDVIELGAGTYTGQLEVAKEVTLRGVGMNDTVIDVVPGPSYVLTVDDLHVTVEDLTIDASGTEGVFVEENAPSTTTLVLRRVKVRDASGVGLTLSSGAVSLYDSILCDNDAGDGVNGGAVRVEAGGTLTAQGSVFFGNHAAEGAAVHSAGSTVLDHDTFDGNRAGDGVAVRAIAGTITFIDNLVLRNDEDVVGGGTQYAFDANGATPSGGNNFYWLNEDDDADPALADDVHQNAWDDGPGYTEPLAACAATTLDDFRPAAGGPVEGAASDGTDIGAVQIDPDSDGDGSPDSADCAPDDPTVNPGSEEQPGDGVDQNCDGIELCFVDADRDGQRSNLDTEPSANLLCDDTGLADAEVEVDCDDSDRDVFVDSLFVDNDGDLDGSADEAAVEVCNNLEGYVPTNGDCDDDNPDVYTGAADECDGLNNDCIGGVDDDPSHQDLLHPDVDEDGYGDENIAMSSCPKEGWTTDSTDCDDSEPSIHPTALEQCNGVDDDCDGYVDNDIVFQDWFVDDDGDGFGEADSTPTSDCLQPPGSVANALDCDDTTAAVSPARLEEPCDGVDNDCNAETLDDPGTCMDTGDTGDSGHTADTSWVDTSDTGAPMGTGDSTLTDTGVIDTGGTDTSVDTSHHTGSVTTADTSTPLELRAESGCTCTTDDSGPALMHLVFGRRR